MMGRLPGHTPHCRADIDKQLLEEIVIASDIEFGAPTMVRWESATSYLTFGGVDATFHWTQRISRIDATFTYIA